MASSPRDANASMLAAYCSLLGGQRPIRSILIANNGIAAVKFINSIRTWAYETFGEERCIQLLALATPDDMRANAEHIRMADSFVEVPGGTNNNNYANVQLIVEIAQRTRVDAVWPGWGHASENPQLPQKLGEHGIAFLGPPAHAMATLGDKIGSTLLAQAAGVPTIPWSGSGVFAPEMKGEEDIPEDIYQQACVHSAEQAVACCDKIGFPAMIKASWGGGGKGIRKVFNADDVAQLFKQVQGEVPGSPIFVMKMASQSRHLEVQLACDVHGNIISLHSRDCSIQRRHQKIIEEGPITIAPEATVRAMEAGARRLAKLVGYRGVATVEYLYSMESGEYFFLEVNPRLQVEHPVTEWIADVNIPSLQLNIAMGVPLSRMPEIRRFFGQDGGGPIRAWKEAAAAPAIDLNAIQNPIWGSSQSLPKPKGHVVAVRITSEDPDDGFKPTCGRVNELNFRSKPDVWAYFSIKAGGQVHEFSDSQFGHIFAFGATRPLAIDNMVLVLKRLQIRGEIRTIVNYVVDLLKDEEYQGNKVHTGWLDSRIAKQIRVQRAPWHVCVIAGALQRVTQHVATCVTEYIGYLEKGQIPPVNVSLIEFEEVLNIENVKYTVKVVRKGPGSFSLRAAGGNKGAVEVLANTHTLRDGGLLVQLDGNSHVVYSEEEAAGTRLLIDGRTCLLQNEHDPSLLVAETPCKLVRYLAPDGAHLAADQGYAEVEVMKMCMPLLTPAPGTLRRVMPEGQPMKGGDLVARLDLDDPSAVKRSAPFQGELPALGAPAPLPEKAHHRFQVALDRAQLVLDGYSQDVEEVMRDLLEGLSNCEALPFLQWRDVMAVLATRLDKGLKTQLDQIMEPFAGEAPSEEDTARFPARDLLNALEDYLDTLVGQQRAAVAQQVAPLLKVAEGHAAGPRGFKRSVAEELLQRFLAVEAVFSRQTRAEVVENLRQMHKKDLAKVVELVLSHQGVQAKNELVLRLLDSFVAVSPERHRATLEQLAALSPRMHSEVVFRASQLLVQLRLKALQEGVKRNLSDLTGASLGFTGTGTVSPMPSSVNERIQWLVESPGAIDDALACLFSSPDAELRTRAMETYIRRLYQVYIVKGSVKTKVHGQCAVAMWNFWEERPPPTVEALGDSDKGDGLSTPKMRSTVGGTGASAPVLRWGFMLVAPSMEAVHAQLGALLGEVQAQQPRDSELDSLGDEERDLVLLKKTLSSGLSFLSGAPSGGGNVVHLAVAPEPGQAQSLDPKLVSGSGMAATLRAAGVSAVSCMMLPAANSGTSTGSLVAHPVRRCFHWTEAQKSFEEQPLWQHVEPPLSVLLELDRLAALPSITYRRSRNGQWHMLASTDSEQKPPLRRLFLRAVVRLSTPLIKSSSSGLLNGMEDEAATDMAHRDTEETGPVERCLVRAGVEGEEGFAASPVCAMEEGNALDAAASRAVAVRCQNLFYPCRLTAGRKPLQEEEKELLEAAKDMADAINAATAEAELDADALNPDYMHIFMAVPGALRVRCPGVALSPEEEHEPVRQALCRLGRTVDALVAPGLHMRAVSEWEARVHVTLDAGAAPSSAWRIVAQNPSKFSCSVQAYMEAGDTRQERKVYFSPLARTTPRPGGMGGTTTPLVKTRSGTSTRMDTMSLDKTRSGNKGDTTGLEKTGSSGRFPLADRQAEANRVQTVDKANALVGVALASNAASAGGSEGAVGKADPLHYTSLGAPCGPLPLITRRRVLARRAGTTYCYDFVPVIASALQKQWEESRACGFLVAAPAGPLLEARELVFESSPGTWETPLVESNRPPGSNTVGMVGWHMCLATPEFPSGRPLLVVANDVTLGSGAFGLQEDMYFRAMAQMACRSGVPLVYLAANSGARIGVAEEVKRKIRAAWVDEAAPEKGFEYLYLAPEDYGKLRGSVLAHEVEGPEGEVRWRVTDIIGAEDGLGVENLSGSGAIASAFSKAYEETFTLTYVTGRTVGIGAYLARLGSRCVQRLDQPIILTGYSALNKLLGREVYSSHMQLGGPKVMATNGVVHATVKDDLEGVASILKWLSFVPALAGTAVPRVVPVDPVTRLVGYVPEGPCRPRAAIAGAVKEQQGSSGPVNTFVQGIFDDGSFMETLSGWAQGVVVGRARLGGVPVGIIAVETATVMQCIPADPGQLDSHERTVPQAGQVWFPDNALKTAQALLDFQREGLPLFILANWRGFSGGQRDLFEGILQAGSLIVDRLRTYQRPAFVYIPKNGELRGGAWVVVDSKINPSVVEMYAESTARGAVLEPEGTVEIKFREPEVKAAMARLDARLAGLKQQLQSAQEAVKAAEAAGAAGDVAGDVAGAKAQMQGLKGQVQALKGQVAARERQLMPVYMQLAVRFAALHDTPQRMAAKGAIRRAVPWDHSRTFFAMRLRRRQMEDEYVLQFAAGKPRDLQEQQGSPVPVEEGSAALRRPTQGLPKQEIQDFLKAAFEAQQGAPAGEGAWEDDTQVLGWLEGAGRQEELQRRLEEQAEARARRASLQQLQALRSAHKGRGTGTVVDGILAALSSLSAQEKLELVEGLKNLS